MELYMVCILIAIALSMLIFKGIQLVLSIVYPWPNVSEIKLQQTPKLTVEPLEVVQTIPDGFNKKGKRNKPRSKRPPRNIRIEQLYSSNPYSFDELDSSFSRRSMCSNKSRPLSRSDEFSNMSPATDRDILQAGIPLEQISFAEDDEEDPIHAYVSQQHQRMVAEAYQNQNRSSTPIENPYAPRQYPKNHATFV